MREQIERLAAETSAKVAALNVEIDAVSPSHGDDEVTQAFCDAAAGLIAQKQTLKEEFQEKCAALVNDIRELCTAMPDVAGPTMSELGPPFRPLLQKLESQTSAFRAVAATRTTQKQAAIAIIREACSELDLAIPRYAESLAESDVRAVEADAKLYSSRLNERKDSMAKTQSKISDMCGFLSEDVPAMPVGHGDTALAELTNMSESIQTRYNAQKQELALLERQASQLAELLDVPTELSASGPAADRLKAVDQRLAELNELKRKHMGQVVQNARVKIAETWNALCVDSTHRESVNAMHTDEASEMELQDLEAERLFLQMLQDDPIRQRIVTLLHEYADLRGEELKLAEASRDPKRLAQRGFSQILKREEATRKLLERRKPPLVRSLLPLLQKWSDEHNGESFMLDGTSIRELVEHERAKLDRRGRTQLPRKRPSSTSAQSVACANPAKRVKPALSTPMLRHQPARPPPQRPLHNPPHRLLERAPSRAAPLSSRIPSTARPGARPAVENAARRPPPRSRDGSQRLKRDAAVGTVPVRAPSKALEANQGQRSAGLATHCSASVRSRDAAQVPRSSERPLSRNIADMHHRRPQIQSTPMVPASRERQPLALQPPSVTNIAPAKAQTQGQADKILDWRTQRKADLQENGLSYYDDSTTELHAHPEESFNFKNFF